MPDVCVLGAPPGVTKTVLGGGGAIVTLELDELEELEELLELELEAGEPHGSIATDWVSVLLGMTSRFEPGGTLLLPDWETTAASEQDVTAIVSGLCCLGITMVLTPGLFSAVETGSELDEPPPLLPQEVSAATDAEQTIKVPTRRSAVLLLISPPQAARVLTGRLDASGQCISQRCSYPIQAAANWKPERRQAACSWFV